MHCSLLPKYSGILPSFWTLFNDEKETGATVHYMDDEIDNGDILGQKSVKILKTDSMFDIIKRTKNTCLLYTSPSPRDMRRSRMPSSA